MSYVVHRSQGQSLPYDPLLDKIEIVWMSDARSRDACKGVHKKYPTVALLK